MAFYNWGVASGAFNIAGSWDDVTTAQNPSTTVPGSGDTVTFFSTGGTITGTGSVYTINLAAGATAPWIFDAAITAESIFAASAFEFGAGASLTLSGVSNPSYLPFTGTINAAATLDDATLDSAGGILSVGTNVSGLADNGAGLTVEAGSTATALAVTIGQGATGSVTVTGQGSSLATVFNTALNTSAATTGYLTVGQQGTANDITAAGSGALTITDDGTVSVGDGLIVGFDAGSSGTVTIGSGGVLTLDSGFADIGDQAGSSGTLTIDAGGTFDTTIAPQTANYYLNIGNKGASGSTPAAVGTVTVQGAGALLDMNDNGAIIAENGTGTLNVLDGGVVKLGTSSTASSAIVSLSLGRLGTGLVDVDGAGSQLDLAGGFYAGRGAGGSGTIDVSNDGTLTETSAGTGDFSAFGTGGTVSGTFVTGGTGTLDITTGGTASFGGTLAFGSNGATGVGIVSDGTLAAAGALTLGTGTTVTGGTGSLTVEDGGTVEFGGVMTIASTAGTSGTVDIDAGSTLTSSAPSSAQTSYLVIATAAGATGTVDVSGTGAVLDMTGNHVGVGRGGSGTLTIENGATAITGTTDSNVSGALNVALSTGSTGTVDVGGTGSSLTAVGYVFIGRGGSGTLTVADSAVATLGDASDAVAIGSGGTTAGPGTASITGGTGLLQVTSDGVLDAVSMLEIGDNGDTGTATVDAGGTIEAGGQIGIGDGSSTYGSGTGTVTVGAGGTLRAGLTPGAVASGLSSIYLGNYGTSVGTLNVKGAGALADANGYRINIGVISTGFMTVSAGGTALSGSTGAGYPALQLGAHAGSEGTLTITDAGSTFTATGEADIGLASKGHLLIENAGAMTTGSASSGFVIGNSTGSSGDATVTDAGSTLTNTGYFIVGDDGVGTLTIENGATVTTSGATGDGADIALGTGSSGSQVTVTGDGSAWSVAGTLAVDAGGSLVLGDGGTVTAGAVAIAASGTISGAGLLDAGSIADDGVITAAGGTLDVKGAVNGDGTLQIGAGADLAVFGAVNTDSGASVSAVFTAATGILDIKDPLIVGTGSATADGFNAVIAGYQAGDVVEVFGIGGQPSPTYSHSTDNADTILTYANGITLTFAGDYADGAITVEDDPSAPCFCPGTLIMTAQGERPVETLAIGDHVITASGAAKPIRWIGRRSYAGAFIAGQHLMLPVCIKRGALADDVPRQDLWVSPGHAMVLDGQLVPAWRLINGVSVVQAEAVESVTYYHVELACHDVLLANGAAAESFLDDDCRGQFHNAAAFAAAYPNAAPMAALAPRLEDGFALQLIWERIAGRAKADLAPEPVGTLRGFIDVATAAHIGGWAQDVDNPEMPVALEVSIGDRPVLCVLANGYRGDLRNAGMGTGRHAFAIDLPPGLDGVVTVRRVADGMRLEATETSARRAA
jgi:fibronectin-binding autotransporter adhesin